MMHYIIANLAKLHDYLGINIKNIASILMAIFVFLLVGVIDFQEEIESQQVYCSMVDSNLWPDYQGTYSSECTHQV
jgi:hypothetical protein